MARKKSKDMKHKSEKKVKEPEKREEEKEKENEITLPQQPTELAEKEDQGKPEENLEIRKQNNYLKILLIAMMLVMVFIAGVAWFRYQAMRFEYAGLNFEKIMFDKLQMYHAKIPLSSLTGNVVANFNLYFRNDPRELESIPITGRIRLKRNAIVALDPSMEDCGDNAIAGLNLGQFLGAAGIKPLEGSTNLSEALETGVNYASCENVVSSVIITEKSDKTQIIKEGEDCYRIQVAVCEDVVKATERFIIGAIGHSSGYDI